MRIAVSADSNNGLDSVISPHLGRCPYFVLVDVEGCEVQVVNVIENPYFTSHQPGQVPQFINGQHAQVMLTGGMGARALQFFEQFDIQAVTGAAGTVRLSVAAYLGGELQGSVACAHGADHAAPAAGEYEQDDLGRLKEEVQALDNQLNTTLKRIGRLQR